MIKALSTISVLLCFFPSVLAQVHQENDSIYTHYRNSNPKIDSLAQMAEKDQVDTLKVRALSQLFNTFLYAAPALAKEFAEKELKFSEQLQFIRGIGWSTYHLGAYYQNTGQLDSARYFYRRALGIHKELGQKDNFASVTTALANLEVTEGNYDLALEMNQEALEIYREFSKYRMAITQGDIGNIYILKGYYRIALETSLEALRVLDTVYDKPWRQADVQKQVGTIEYLRKNYTNALNYYKKALATYKEQEDRVYQANVSQDIGQTYYLLKSPDSASRYFTEALELATEYEVNQTRANALAGLGIIYRDKKDYPKAMDALGRALAIQEAGNYFDNILATSNEIGLTYDLMGDPGKAIEYFERTINEVTGEVPIALLKDAYTYRARAFQNIGRWEEALRDTQKAQDLNDSIFNTVKSQQIEALRITYETEKNQQQIALQKKEITVLEQKASINTLQIILLAGGLLLALLGIYALRQKIKRNKAERAKLDAELAFKKKELTTHALHLAKKNEVLEQIKSRAQELKANQNASGYNQLIKTINFDQQDDKNWENFTQYFEQVHKDFSKNVKSHYPEVTKNELRFMALLKMNMSSKEIATILNISADGVKKARQRLRKKMNLKSEDSLEAVVLAL